MTHTHTMFLCLSVLMMVLHSASEAAPASFEDQVSAYLQHYPYQQTYDYAARFTGRDPAKLNAWAFAGEPQLVKAGSDVVPRTNHDTFYQAATLWLEDGPIVLTSNNPSKHRFNSFQLIDDRNANYRNIVHPQGDYTLYFGRRPEQIRGEAIEVPSRLSVVIVRVEVKDENDSQDVTAAKAVLNGMTITGTQPVAFPRLELLSEFPDNVIAEANRRMDEVFRSVAFRETVVGPGQEPGTDVPHLYHAAGSKGGYGAPDPRHSAFERKFRDKIGRELQGANSRYTLTTREPPVDAFWSITVYDTDRGGFLHPNNHDRYHINDTLAHRNADGTVTVTFQASCTSATTNCLEVPAGRFEVVARYYLPHEEIVTGAWTLPDVELIVE